MGVCIVTFLARARACWVSHGSEHDSHPGGYLQMCCGGMRGVARTPGPETEAGAGGTPGSAALGRSMKTRTRKPGLGSGAAGRRSPKKLTGTGGPRTRGLDTDHQSENLILDLLL